MQNPVPENGEWVYSFELPATKATTSIPWWTTGFLMTGDSRGSATGNGIGILLNESSEASNTGANYKLTATGVVIGLQMFCVKM